MKHWRVTIVGAGYIADAHLLALRALPSVEVCGLCDTNESRARAMAQAWRIPYASANLDELLRDARPQAVHITTPPTAHLEPALACLHAGCHIFCEKPLAPDSANCRRIEDTAANLSLAAAVNHNQSFHPAVLSLVEMARARRFGRIECVTVCLSTGLRQLSAGQHQHWMFDAPGNILLEQAPHPLSQIVRLLGSVQEAAVLTCGARTLNTGALFYDTWQISLICQRGPAQLLLAFGRDDVDSWIHVTGQDASAHGDLRRNTITVHPKSRWVPPVADLFDAARNGTFLAMQGARGLANYTLGFLKLKPPQDTFHLGMRASIAAFYEALSAGRPLPVPAREGREIVEACELIANAANRAATELAGA